MPSLIGFIPSRSTKGASQLPPLIVRKPANVVAANKATVHKYK